MNSVKQAPGQPLGNDRLLTVQDVSAITHLTAQTSATLMRETGRIIARHRRLFILESDLLGYLQSCRGIEEEA